MIAIFGGTAQLIITWLIHISGNGLALAWYLLGAGTVGLVGMVLMPETAPVKVGERQPLPLPFSETAGHSEG